MILRHLFDDRLAQSSYLIGCAGTGEAIVLDPTCDTDRYLEAAAREGLHIVAVAETHIHADFASGSLNLAHNTGATLFLSGEGGTDWHYDISRYNNIKQVQEGAVLSVGQIRLTVWHTPGHTPEHLTFLLTDTAASTEPLGAFTGDFVFVGDVGRPDLLEKAVRQAGTMRQSASALYQSLQRLGSLPDGLLLFPGHSAGSACGKSLGGIPLTTLGYERHTNWAFHISSEESFIQTVLDGQPEPPAYFAQMKRINKALLVSSRIEKIPRFSHMALDRTTKEGWIILDVRPASLFGAGHLPGAVNIPHNKSFLTLAGTILPYDIPLLLFAENSIQAQFITEELRLIGMETVQGWVGNDTLTDESQALPQINLSQLDMLQTQGAIVVDVRQRSEWQQGHIPGARNLPLSSLMTQASDLPHDVPLVVHCQGGTRSPLAASFLRRMGFSQVFHCVTHSLDL